MHCWKKCKHRKDNKNESVECSVYGTSDNVMWYDTFEKVRKKCVDVKDTLPELDRILGLE